MHHIKKLISGGFSLIEVIIIVVLITLISLAIYSALVIGFNGVKTIRQRQDARGLATQKLEELKNLPYDSLATQFGTIYPPGTISDNIDINVSGITYTTNTNISFVDDPYDGNFEGTIPGKPVDLYPYDYKKIEIKVTEKNKTKILAELTTNVSSKAAETETNTGILSLKVIDAQGQPVPSAQVQVKNTNIIPNVLINSNTDLEGKLAIPKLPPDTNYQVITTLPGYSTDQTLPATVPNPNPAQPNITILVQQVSNLTLSIDRLSTMQINVQNTLGTPLPGLSITTKSDKLKYTTPDVPKYQSTNITDVSGSITLSNMEWDSYAVSPPLGYFISTSSPIQHVGLQPNTPLTVTLTLTTSAIAPTISSFSPQTSTATTPVVISITGTNLFDTTQVVLQKTGQTDITAQSVSAAADNLSITATFNLTSAPTGNWDLQLTNLSGLKATQPAGFQIQ